MNGNLTRDDVIEAIRAALEPLNTVNAMWEAGSSAFQRADQWSDLDLQVDVADDCVDSTFTIVENTLAQLSPIEHRYIVPTPTWHGHAQAFYRLKNTTPYLIIDFVVMKRSSTNRFLQVEVHGQPLVYFDKCGAVTPEAFHPVQVREMLSARVQTLRDAFAMFQIFVQKELNRENWLDALAYYQSQTLRPLVELLRIRHDPARYNFGPRYLYLDLPVEIVQQLEGLFFIANPHELAEKQRVAQQLFWQTAKEIETEGLHLE